MAIPDFQSIMLPLMEFVGDKKDHRVKEAVEKLSEHFGLTEDEKSELLPSGRQSLFYNRVAWAKYHLAGAGLIEASGIGIFHITDRGLNTLREKPTKINMRFLFKFSEYKEFRAKKNDEGATLGGSEKGASSDATPEEQLEASYQAIRQSLAQELITVRWTPSVGQKTGVLKVGSRGEVFEFSS